MLHYEEGILVTGDAAMQPNVVHVHKVCIDWYTRLIFCACIIYYDRILDVCFRWSCSKTR